MKYYFYKIKEKYLNKLFPQEIVNYIMEKLIPKQTNTILKKYNRIYYPTTYSDSTKYRVLCYDEYSLQQCSICSHLRIMVFSNKFKCIEYLDCECEY